MIFFFPSGKPFVSSAPFPLPPESRLTGREVPFPAGRLLNVNCELKEKSKIPIEIKPALSLPAPWFQSGVWFQ